MSFRIIFEAIIDDRGVVFVERKSALTGRTVTTEQATLIGRGVVTSLASHTASYDSGTARAGAVPLRRFSYGAPPPPPTAASISVEIRENAP